ncbi:MAG: hypothetical protein ACTSPB_01205 [Candidatus Thorarchaeota archaeon]
MKALKTLGILICLSACLSLIGSAIMLKNANGINRETKPTDSVKDPFWSYHATTSETVIGYNMTPIEPPDTPVFKIEADKLVDLIEPFNLVTFIWEALKDGDDYDQLDVDASFHMNDTTIFMSFYNVNILYDGDLITQQLDVDEIHAVFKNNLNDTTGIGFLANYYIEYSNLTITQTLHNSLLGGSIDVYQVDGNMKVSHHYSPYVPKDWS